MTTRTSTIEDLESGKDKEFERIKQNFAPSPNRNTQGVCGMTFPYLRVFSLDDADYVAGNLGETHLALQGLQSELQEFLAQYIAKVIFFSRRISREDWLITMRSPIRKGTVR